MLTNNDHQLLNKTTLILSSNSYANLIIKQDEELFHNRINDTGNWKWEALTHAINPEDMMAEHCQCYRHHDIIDYHLSMIPV